jgi:hypothetical protein
MYDLIRTSRIGSYGSVCLSELDLERTIREISNERPVEGRRHRPFSSCDLKK